MIAHRVSRLTRVFGNCQAIVRTGIFRNSTGLVATPVWNMSDIDDGAGLGSRRFKVYTRTGDKGQSSLYNGERRNKDDAIFEALGDVDELNAHVGVSREHVAVASMGFEEQLVWIQSRLLDVGSAIATPPDRARPELLARVAFPLSHSDQLEHWIDAMDEKLPPLANFILPSGGLASANLHVARTVCRRAERAVVHLSRIGVLSMPLPAQPSAAPDGGALPKSDAGTSPESPIGPGIPTDAADAGASTGVHPVAIFLNRLSDYLFVAARYACMLSAHDEQVYKKASGIVVRPAKKAAVQS